MILLRPDCLVFETPQHGNIPCSIQEVTVEWIGEAVALVDRELLENAAAAVLHYFRVEQQRETVTVAEFTEALEKVLQGLGLQVKPAPLPGASGRPCVEQDLFLLAGEGGELFFFPRVRDVIRRQLEGRPLVLRFHGLRACVRYLTGAKRWSSQCRALNDRIVEYLRMCFEQEKAGAGSALVVFSGQ